MDPRFWNNIVNNSPKLSQEAHTTVIYLTGSENKVINSLTFFLAPLIMKRGLFHHPYMISKPTQMKRDEGGL